MPKNLLHSSDWMLVNQVDDKVVEIDVTGIIGGSFYYEDDNKDSKNTREKMRAELKAIAEIKATKIIVNIDSPGGSVSHGLSIHDLLAQNPAEKEVRIIGMTASIATVIAQAGNTRKMSDNALFLIHHAITYARGNITDLQMAIDDVKAVDAKIINIYTKKGAEEAKVSELMDANNGNGRWIDAIEAKEYGLIDEVTEPTKAAAMFDRELFNKLKYPEIPMTKKAEDAKGFFARMKEGFINAFKVDEKTEIPAEVTDKLTEFETMLNDLETENNDISAQVETLTAQVTEKDQAIATKDTEIQALKDAAAAKVTEFENLQTEFNKLQAASTKPGGPTGKEGVGEGMTKVGDPELDQIVNGMKAMATEVRPDPYEAQYKEKEEE